jgi:hypothetical protein
VATPVAMLTELISILAEYHLEVELALSKVLSYWNSYYILIMTHIQTSKEISETWRALRGSGSEVFFTLFKLTVRGSKTRLIA